MSDFFTVHSYSLTDWLFADRVADLFDCDDLSTLHERIAAPTGLLKPVQDQSTPFHKTFYAAFSADAHNLRSEYLDFIRGVVRPLAREMGLGAVIYQAVPTFRVQLPGNLAVGEFHKDGDYGHPEGEMAFWLPLTEARGTAAVQFGDPAGPLVSADVSPGQFWVGNTRDVLHGNLPNTTGKTRVSFDFRVLPLEKYDPNNASRSVAAKKRFIVGDYWAYGDKK
jgi:hypothetical protein